MAFWRAIKFNHDCFCSDTNRRHTQAYKGVWGGKGMCFCFLMRFRTAFHEGTLDHGTTDDYFFLIISLLGKPVITLEQKVWDHRMIFFELCVCMEQVMRGR